jgi:protein arginine N-methyltransferase 1
MSRHTKRVDAYKKAIDAAIISTGKSNPVLLEVGSGYGELSKYAAENKCRVYSVESNHDAAESLKADSRGLDLKIIESDIRNVLLPEKADIIISELMGNLGPEYAMGPLLDFSRDRFLVKDGIMIPQEVHAFMQYTKETENLDDLSFGMIKNHHTTFINKAAKPNLLIGKPINVWSYVWNKKNSNKISALAPHMANANSIAGYFVANLFNGITINNHPSVKNGSWKNLMLPIGTSTNPRAIEADINESGFRINTKAYDMIVFSQSSITTKRDNIWQQLYKMNQITDAPVSDNYADWVRADTGALLNKTRAQNLTEQIELLRDPHINLMLQGLTQKGILLLYTSSGLDGSLDWLPENARALARVNTFDSNKIYPAMETASDSTKESYVQKVAEQYGVKQDRILRLTTGSNGLNTSNLSISELFRKVV